MSRERTAAALEGVETVEVGEGYLLPSGDSEDFEAVEALGRGSVDLLPKWDSYTMGYAPDERRRFVHPEVQTRVYNEPGHGLGVVLVEGAAAGAWGMRFAGGTGRMLVDLDLFERPGAKLRRAIDERFEEAASLLSARSVSFGYTCGIGAARYRSLPKPA